MSIPLEIFLIFFKTSSFSFGGGYAMVSVIEREVVGRGFLTAAQYADIVAISQITPGPLVVNVATYVGAVLGETPALGVLYSAIATLGVSLPSFILIFIIGRFFKSFGDSEPVKKVMGGVRPTVIGLILGAVVSFGKLSLFDINEIIALNFLSAFDIRALIIAVMAFFINFKTKINPMLILLGAGIVGVAIYSFF